MRNNHRDSWIRLVAAIVLQAEYDWLSADPQMHNDADIFLKSDWFVMLVGISGKEVLTRLQDGRITEVRKEFDEDSW